MRKCFALLGVIGAKSAAQVRVVFGVAVDFVREEVPSKSVVLGRCVREDIGQIRRHCDWVMFKLPAAVVDVCGGSG